ncbi:xanthine dehydrogenase family protein molybdopterin-binding subunit [Bradyrhizobium sp. CCBAU 53340]|uniref:xanthine dehydrogenase family protein molybdopterin-binding subunit n=1 Tax=Bradyrhizobium sp. CCBAU 53340 TaxID=1325112 RepID=UPI00188B1196|nr:molybdopterin cofactor-binding domain-containing protein [Bradyrhizobium sp. CCBAU 53340]QOZ44735.1 xanthine dehydrogenase family protein molybdopterin-binding subunit [Bradyrhizobium sp. CCBAU 53340]
MNKRIEKSEALLSRRQVMIGAAGLSFAIALPENADAVTVASDPSGKTMSPWISISPDGTISIMSPAAEMGQGSMTALPLIVAEELDADWSRVNVVPAPIVDEIYGSPIYRMLYTAGSYTLEAYYTPLRVAGAQVRRVLLENVARKWGVPFDELATEPSVVVHQKSGRRLTYGDIAKFADVPATAPEITLDQLKKPADFRLIGKDRMRVELPLKVNGSATYSIDVQVPGMLYGVVLRAPIEGAIPDKINEAVVKALPGVVSVVRLPHGVGVVAETVWAGLKAREALNGAVTWTRTGLAWGFDSDKGLDAFAARARNVKGPSLNFNARGQARAELEKAASVVEGEYRTDYAYHAQMEPLNAVAFVAPDGGSVEIWAGTQGQSIAQTTPAKFLDIPRDKVKLNNFLLGGGFGRRGSRDADFIMDAVMLSKEVGRPIKTIWTREDDVRNGRFRSLSANFLRAGFDGAGKLIAWHHRVAADRLTQYLDPVRFVERGGRDGMLMSGTDVDGYDVPNFLVEQSYQETGVRTSPLRAIGANANKFATEAFMDDLARSRRVDPLDFRLELLKGPRARKVVERVCQMAEWSKKRSGRALGLAYMDFQHTHVAGVAEVSLDQPSGKITVHNFWSTVDCGLAVQPDNVVAQLEGSIVFGIGLAMSERISIKDGAVEQSNFYDYAIPRMNEIPEIHVEVIKTDNAPTGVSEAGTPLVAPCISNAIMELSGVRLRHTPFLPERVKKAIA